jgi:hypothetical protein
VRAIFAAAFGEYGQPEAIRSNSGGAIRGARAVGEPSRLSLNETEHPAGAYPCRTSGTGTERAHASHAEAGLTRAAILVGG